MKVNFTLPIFIGVLWLNATHAILTAVAQPPTESRLQVTASNPGQIVLELTVAGERVEAIERDGQRYQRLLIPGTVQSEAPGEPELPTMGALLGVPTIQGISIEILEAEFEILETVRIPPAPAVSLVGDDPLTDSTPQVFTPDELIYATAAFYPDPIVTVGQTALMRDQPVVQVQFFPAQYNPTSRQVRLYRRILARISWPTNVETQLTAVGRSPAYEQLLQNTLLNYGTLSRPLTLSSPTANSKNLAETAGVSPTLKIGVDEDGIYQLTHSDIISSGFDLSGVDPRSIKLTRRGSQIPITVNGEADGSFDPGDTILFYGTAITNRYTTRNIYWLTAGDGNGRRMLSQDGTPQGALTPVHFPVTQRFEEDSYYWQAMPPHMGPDPWFWWIRYSAPVSRSYSVTLTNISTVAGTATLRLRLAGQTDIAAVNPDHHTKLSVNNLDIEPAGQWWDGQRVFDHQVTISQSAILTEGINKITLAGVGDTGAAVDQFLLDWIEIDYWDTYVAEDNSLTFGAPASGAFQFEITGFTGSDIALFNVTDPANVTSITGPTVTGKSGGFKLRFGATAQPDSRFLALTTDRFKTPALVEPERPSAWKSTENGADYIIITHDDFYTSALRLADHRHAAGLRVATVKVGDIYDEFNHGVFYPPAIRDFLSYTYHHWQPPAPTYVLLVGDAVFDYKDHYKKNKINYVPAPIVYTEGVGETPADNWFVTVSGSDIMPDMFIGRLSIETAAQANDIIDNIIQYEQAGYDMPWHKHVLLVADDRNPAFETTSEELAALLPAPFTATKVYAAAYPPGNPTLDINAAINSGSLLVNYVGHGNSLKWGSWSGGRIYDTANIAGLTNAGKLPIVTIANCLNGFFTSPFSHLPIAETFVRLGDKGAVAVWAPTGLGYPSGHRALMTKFYKAVFQHQQYSLGAATTAAQIAIAGHYAAWDELIETYVLFGDPALRLAIPHEGKSLYLPIIVQEEK